MEKPKKRRKKNKDDIKRVGGQTDMTRRGHFICSSAADYGGGLVSLIYLVDRSCQSRPLLWLDPSPTLIKKKKRIKNWRGERDDIRSDRSVGKNSHSFDLNGNLQDILRLRAPQRSFQCWRYLYHLFICFFFFFGAYERPEP